jgi:hypothetical protein
MTLLRAIDRGKGIEMHGKFVITAVAVFGWLAASLVAFVIVTLFDFLGIGLIGVLIAFASAQVELDSDTGAGGAYGAGMIAKQVEAERQRSPEQRAAARNERSLVIQSARFFRHFGLALAIIGFGGFAYRYLL